MLTVEDKKNNTQNPGKKEREGRGAGVLPFTPGAQQLKAQNQPLCAGEEGKFGLDCFRISFYDWVLNP